MSVQHVRGAGTVCEMTMQHLRGPFTVCEMTMQHLHSPFTVCGGTMQHLHSPFTVCEMTMQHLHGLFTVCETIMQHLHSLVAVCAPVPRRLIIHPYGMSGGRMQFAPTPGTRKKFAAPAGAECNSPLPGYNHSAYMYQAKFAGVRRRPLTLPP